MDDWTNATGDYCIPEPYMRSYRGGVSDLYDYPSNTYEAAMRAQQMGQPLHTNCQCDCCPRSGRELNAQYPVRWGGAPRVGSVGVLDGPKADVCRANKMFLGADGKPIPPRSMPNISSDASNDHNSDILRQIRDLKRDLRILGSRGYAEPFTGGGDLTVGGMAFDMAHVLLFIFVVIIFVFIQFSQKITDLKSKLASLGSKS